jgi:hypothetical protein
MRSWRFLSLWHALWFRGSANSGRVVGNAEVIPVALQRSHAARTGFRKVGRARPNSLIACRAAAVRTAVTGKLNPLEKTTFYDLRVSVFTSALSLVRGETIITFSRLRIEETELMNCTNRLRHRDEQQPRDLSDIRRVGRGLTGHGVVLLATWSASTVNQYGDLASHSAICRTELSYPRNVCNHNRPRVFFVLP